MKLADFLRARLDEDAAAARRVESTWRQIGETGVIVASDGGRAEECANGNWTGIAEHIVRHDPDRVLREIEVDRELLREYEQLLRAHEAHKKAAAELAADIEQEELTGRWEGVGDPGTRQRALRREADYLPAMLHVLEKWAKAKAAVHSNHPDYDASWKP